MAIAERKSAGRLVCEFKTGWFCQRAASKVDDIIDELVVGDGSDPSRFITISFHPDETVEEVLEFARAWEREKGQAVQLVKL
ncbi:hypothetical protein [Bradyrhizobium sp. 2TAF24]|uniref:hypothetical protein n=1 Tax=Bradyrhizobium sp. 2TAF24 TaxID=3233011 RepID=UPI003F9029FB